MMMHHRRRMLLATALSLPPKDTLQNTSWENIAKVAAAAKAAAYWSVGDTKTITFGSAVLGSTSIVVKIMGFEYDDLADGSGKAKISFGMANCFATKQSMNSSDTTAGGWTSCALRATIINTLLPAFITAIGANIIKPVTKRTSAGSLSTTINTSTDSLWLLSEYEVFGAATYSAAGEKPTDKSICYPIFTSAASRIKNVDSSAAIWWERSPGMSTGTAFCAVYPSGGGSGGASSSSHGVALGFCV